MMKGDTMMRRMRAEYGITLRELAAAAGTNYRLISKIELGRSVASPWCLRLAKRGFEGVIARRTEQNQALANHYSAYKDCLLDSVAEACK